jgi:hypothetical protein
MLVKFQCGCKGFRYVCHPRGVRCWVIEPCDGDGSWDDSPRIWERSDLATKTFEPLVVEEVERLMKRLRIFVDKGHRFATIQATLWPDSRPDPRPED